MQGWRNARRRWGRSRSLPSSRPTRGTSQTGRDILRFAVGFYVGGMGSREQNFYNTLVRRYGFVEEAERIQDLFLGGDKGAAIAAVPDEMVDAVSLAGD